MPGTLSPTVVINGSELTDHNWLAALTEVRVEREFGVPGRVTLRFNDPGFTRWDTHDITIGAPLVVRLSDELKLINATVTGMSVTRQGGAEELTVVGHDKSYKLARTSAVKAYLGMAYSDVISQLAQSAGLSADTSGLSPQTMEYIIQADSDLAWLGAMADRAGFDWWVDDAKLVCAPPPSAPTDAKEVQLYRDLLDFSVRASGLHPNKVKVSGWDRTQAQVVVGQSAAAETAKRARPDDHNLANFGAASALGDDEATLTSLNPLNQAEAVTLAKAALDRAFSGGIVAQGRMEECTPSLGPGKWVKVTDAGPLSGSYYVTKVEHLYSARGFSTKFAAGDTRPTSLVDTLGGPSGNGRVFQQPGLVCGLVTNVGDPDSRGRVKVKLPGLASDLETSWARVATPGGGPKRGAVFLPEVGDEVLVGFEGGDMRQPVVLGGLFNERDSKIPYQPAVGGKITSRRIMSRAGHVFELSDGDAPNEKYFLLQLTADAVPASGSSASMFLVSGEKAVFQVPAGIPITIASGDQAYFKIDDQGNVSIKGLKVSIESETELDVKAGANGSVKAQANLALEGAAQTSLKGAITQINGDGTTEIKGGMVTIN